MFKILLSIIALTVLAPAAAMAEGAAPNTPTTAEGATTAPTMPPPPAPGTVVLPTSGDGPVPPLTLLPGELPLAEHPLLRLMPDKIEVVKLDRNAVNVLVGNNKHLLAIMETPRQILLIPRAPGATHLQVLDAKGETILARSVIVAAPTENYVRIRRTCATKDDGTCQEYSVFYCPDMCHNVNVTQETQTGTAGVIPTGTASGSAVPPGSGGGLTGTPVEGAEGPGDIGAATGNALMVP